MRSVWYRIGPLLSPYPQALDRYYLLLGQPGAQISAKERVDYLYSVLGILDAKASALMTVCCLRSWLSLLGSTHFGL